MHTCLGYSAYPRMRGAGACPFGQRLIGSCREPGRLTPPRAPPHGASLPDALPKGWSRAAAVRGPPVYWNRKFQHRADFLDRDHRDTHACMGDPFAWPKMRVARLVDNGPQRNTWAPCNIKKEAGLESPQPQAHLEACAALTLGTRGLISRRSRLVLCPRRSCVANEPLCVAV